MTNALTRSGPWLFRRLLETPDFAETIRALPAPALGQLVAHVGVDDAGALLAVATPAQLTQIVDEVAFIGDRLDPERFGVWLEVMLEAGDRETADRLVEMSEDLLQAAIHEFAMVMDLEALAVRISEDNAMVEVNDVLEQARTEELLGFLLVAKRVEGWDAMWEALLALAERHVGHLEAVLGRLCDLDMDRAAEEGLCELLSDVDLIVEQAAGDREDRRAASGYVSVSDARAFLALARDGAGDPDKRDAITAAWFRRLGPTDFHPPPPEEIRELLNAAEAHQVEQRSRALPLPGPESQQRLRRAMEALRERDPDAYALRLDELAYLANAVTTGLGLGAYRVLEGMELAAAICGEGMMTHSAGPENDVSLLAQRSLDLLFRTGYPRTRAATQADPPDPTRTIRFSPSRRP